ncbi:Glutamate--tRNA ligase, mitochondrial [Lachnellula occidentalis]|uniref:Glutamate--tRNA ligase, mitochondrial n=1 Tax=Lachnellula occidentalis TaxID=215460 RepID=A0A8H8RY86_9HELO|nr:Glutamate--tRNA ligase, mitochondrial [Lachnellula occidentalis]
MDFWREGVNPCCLHKRRDGTISKTDEYFGREAKNEKAMMYLLLSSARRTLASRWICQSCRGIKHASTNVASYTPPEPSKAARELRNGGPARTRFAPSPTGNLHLGSLRTALFNYLVAKATGGQFLLRIEDTDQKRKVPGAEERLYKDLEWAGIEWDEGPRIGGPYGPYIQSQRTAIYRSHVEQLLESGNAYRCFCSPERLNDLAKHRQSHGNGSEYDRKCAHVPKEHSDDRAAKGEAHVVRLKAPDKYPVYNDLVYGLVRQRGDYKQKVPHEQYDDPILLKSDGFPTYHLANVVDDHLMKITHVIRGSEWMSSTPKHLAMYQAFGWEPPKFAHVSLLVDKTGAKLSKRTGSVELAEWRDKEGIFPEVLNNFVSLLGWSHSEKHDVMNMEELIRAASLKFTRGDTIVAFEKLWFLQRRQASRYVSLPPSTPYNPRHDINKLALPLLLKHLAERSDLPEGPPPTEDFVRALLWADAQNYTTPSEFITRNITFFTPPTSSDLRNTLPSLKLHNIPARANHSVPPSFATEFASLSGIEDWSAAKLKAWTTELMEKQLRRSLDEVGSDEEKLRDLFKKAWAKAMHGYIRWAIAAGKAGPDGAVSMAILGKEETLRRFDLAREVMMGVVDDGADMFAPNGEVESGSALDQETGASDGGDAGGGRD